MKNHISTTIFFLCVFAFPIANWHFKLMPRTDAVTVDDCIDGPGRESTAADAVLFEDRSSPIWNVIGCDKKVLSEWDKFRAVAYDTCVSIGRRHKFGMTDLQIYDGFMKTFFAESKFHASKKAINPITKAKGLIQWMPSIRKKLNIPDNVYHFKLVDQLPYVSKYIDFKMKDNRINGRYVNSFVDIYCLVFAPAYADAPDNAGFYKSCTQRKKQCPYKRNGKGKRCAYHANSAYDVNKDGVIRKNEISKYILDKHYND